MKCNNPIVSFVSILLTFMYLGATVGFDIHTDHHDGEVFVVSLLGHTDCESIHPDDVCHCLEHHNGHCHNDDEDCENEISVISLTGDGFDLVVDCTPLEFLLCTTRFQNVDVSCPGFFDTLKFIDTSPRQYLNNLCVLRV